MNTVILLGRLTRDPDIRYTQAAEPTCIARYTLAVDRRFKREGEQAADFISCVAFGRSGEFAEKYLRKGTKIAVRGRIQTGSYTNKDGVKVYTTDVVVEEHDFAGAKAENTQENQNGQGYNPAGQQAYQQPAYHQQTLPTDSNGFLTIPDGVEDELPFI